MTHNVITQKDAITQPDPLFVVDESTNEVSYNSVILNPAGGERIKSLYGGLKGVYPSPAFILGVFDTIVAGLNATDNTNRPIGNHHVSLNVTVLTGSGVVVVTGDSVSELTGLVTNADTENITVDATGRYQTIKKWHRTTNITIPGGITGITYNIEQLGYWDYLNNDFTIDGYRSEVVPTNAATISFQLQIFKVQDDGNNKWSLVPIEDITLKGAGGDYIDDGLRTAGDDRSWNNSTPFTAGDPHVLKQSDFNTYFSSDENIIEGSSKHEGIIIELIWGNTDYYSLNLHYTAN